MKSKSAPKLSIVIPIFNEEKLINELIKRLEGLVNLFMNAYAFKEEDIHFLFVNDGSSDQSFEILKACCERKKNWILINLSRNFGHQYAISAGIDYVKNGPVAVIDGDLQDPPELIVDMYKRYLDGYDVIYAERTEREGETFFKRMTAAVFYKVLYKMVDFNIPLNTGDFRLMSFRVVKQLQMMRETHRYIRGLVSWAGFRQIGVPYKRDRRYAGETKFSLAKMLKFAFDGISSFSTVPLKLFIFLGFIAAFSGFGYAVYVLYLRLFTGQVVRGWSSLMVVVLMLGGIQLMSLGMLGEYIGRLYIENKKRPLYIIEDVY